MPDLTSFLPMPLLRYLRVSHQNDPIRTFLEACLLLFAVWVWFRKSTKKERGWVELSEREIDELVSEFNPEPLCPPVAAVQQQVISGPASCKPKLNGKTVINLASYNFNGLLGDQRVKEEAILSLRHFGVGSCGPPGFYGTTDAHMKLEAQIAQALKVEACVIYTQSFTTSSSLIPAFAKRGDIIIADAGCNFALRKGIQISRCAVRWYEHNNMESLLATLEAVDKDQRKRGAKLTRRFIVTEGIFEVDGSLCDLPTILEFKNKFKYRLILDEAFSFGTLGRTGKGLTEYYDVPAKSVDIILGSMSTTLGSDGGFSAGDKVVADHQRINSAAFVFSAALPSLLATAASTALSILDEPSSSALIFTPLQINIATFRQTVLGSKAPAEIELPSDAISPLQHLHFTRASDWAEEDQLWARVVEECLANGVFVVAAKRLRGQEAEKGINEPRSSLKVCLSAGLSKKDTEKAANVIKTAVTAVLKASKKKT